MTHDEIQEKVIQTIENEWSMERRENNITCDSTVEQIGFNSLDVIELASDLEIAFDIEIELGVLKSASTIGQMVDLVEAKIKEEK